MEIGSVIPPGQDGAFQVGERKPAGSLSDLPASHRRLLDEAEEEVKKQKNAMSAHDAADQTRETQEQKKAMQGEESKKA